MDSPTSPRTPAAFFGHGNPMNALAHNRYTQAWHNFGAAVGRPRAILVISAHWFVNATAVTAMPRPRTIHDFYGFPDELFAVDYPALGAPDVAAEVAEIVKPQWVGLDHDSWGIDHGTWSVLCHAFPRADIPVVQLLIVGSGNIVHNLRRIDWQHPDAGFDWAQRFDDAARETLLDKPGNVLTLQAHRDFAAAVPTPDHFIPMLYLAALADAAGETPDVLIDGYANGSLSMTAYTLDVRCPHQQDPLTNGSVPLPDPDILPTEESNA